MSVIAAKVYKDKIEIAADCQVTTGGTKDITNSGDISKLVKINNLIIGSVGLAQDGSLLQLFCRTHEPERADQPAILNFLSEFLDWKVKKTNTYGIEGHNFIIFKDKLFKISGWLVSDITEFDAIGSGADFALAALHLKHNAKDAVKVACQLDLYCHEPVTVFSVKR